MSEEPNLSPLGHTLRLILGLHHHPTLASETEIPSTMHILISPCGQTTVGTRHSTAGHPLPNPTGGYKEFGGIGKTGDCN